MNTTKSMIIFSACVVCLGLIVIGTVMFVTAKSPQSEPVYAIPRHIQYSFTIQNRTNRLVKEAKFLTYAPVKQTPTQQRLTLEASHPYELVSDDLGNQILQFTFHNLPPFATTIVTVKADLLLSETPNRIEAGDLQPYLQAEKYCEADNPKIVRTAEKLRLKDPTVTAENTFRWVEGHVTYAGYSKNVRGALHAFKTGKGDCTEFMYLFAALSRANNIPARGIAGYVIHDDAVLKPGGYHNWAMFYDDGLWRTADPQRNIFMKHPSNYIAMRLIGQSPDNPMGEHNRFRITHKGLKVRMNG